MISDDFELRRLVAAQAREMRAEAERLAESPDGYESDKDADVFEELIFE